MSSFHDFLDAKLLEDVSREGQITQYEKSLNSLASIRKKLVSNGMSTNDLDNQMTQLNQALSRRLSGIHKWYGAIIRIDQEPINNTPMWKLSTNSELAFHIPTRDTSGVIKIPINWHQYPNPGRPMMKFIEYRQEVVGYNMVNLITYAENRTVDIVPIKTGKQNQYYLIKRKDSGLWATVGGHIDEVELDNPIIAARRELKEETQAEPLVIRQLPSGWVKEVVANPQETPSKDYNSWSLPYIAIINPMFTMKPSDDAVGGEWFDVGDSIPAGLHFSHHRQILHKAFEFLPTLLKQFGKHQSR
jgi:8-oxo-dGTP pyrophosphatase MutT (NUDIX family)